MRKKKKKTLEEYYRIKLNIECVFLFFLNSKTKYISKHLQSITSFTKSTNLQCPILTSKS